MGICMGAINHANRMVEIGIELWIVSYLRRDSVFSWEVDVQRWERKDIKYFYEISAKQVRI